MGARNEADAPVRLILKLRDPGVPYGHFGATSLACELICALLARELGIGVPRFGIAEVSEPFARSIEDEDPTAAELLLRNLGPNFATLVVPHALTWDPSYTSPLADLATALEDLLVFDATVYNPDRERKNPNLLWDGGDAIHVIDHSLAIQAHGWPDPIRALSPLLSDGALRSHCCYQYLHENGSAFTALHERWTRVMSERAWDEMRSHIPDSWESAPGDLDRIFSFLRSRNDVFAEIRASLIRVFR